MIPGDVKDIHVVEKPEEVVGQVIEKTEMKTDIIFSGMEVLGLVAVLLVLGLIYAGFRYKKRQSCGSSWYLNRQQLPQTFHDPPIPRALPEDLHIHKIDNG